VARTLGLVRGSPSVVVVGSGAAGLAAALAASGAGAEVLVLERAHAVGGTTAMSGGVVWMPGHGRAGPVGADDTDAARTYVDAAATGDVDSALVRAFLSDTRRVADEIESRTPLEWEVLERWPDYRGELPGASSGGRSLWPRPLRLAPELEGRVQLALDQPSPQVAPGSPANDGVVLRGHVRGRALVGALLAGALGAGVEVRCAARASELVMQDGKMKGVVVDGAVVWGTVVLASGGFQHDRQLVATYLPGTALVPMGPAGCAGDGLRLARSAGATLGNTSEGWWMPAMAVPGEHVEGVVHYRPLHSERAQPGAILVDRAGRRFVDEAQNYGDVGRAMRHRAPDGRAPDDRAPHDRAPHDRAPDGETGGAGATCWMVFDSAYRHRYPLGPLGPDDADPAWLARADDVTTLAEVTGLPPCNLEATLSRFNAGAARGEDPDFGRGTYPYDRWIGDAGAPHPTLCPLREPPFYALEVHLGCMGTKGGPRTDDRGRVMSSLGEAIAGLYAAGNAAASPFGSATVAGGATLGPALVFGFRAGEAAAADR
jgi:3-oxosteroid 1-dehydrogenase